MKEPDISIFSKTEQYCLRLAQRFHKGQLRKYTNEPYWFHLVNVAALVKEYGHTEDMVCAALLHDVIEDTDCTLGALFDSLPNVSIAANIFSMVSDLTDKYTKEDFPNINREKRKVLEAQRLGAVSEWSQTIKYCDLIDNTCSIVKHDPKFAQTYLKEKSYLLDKMLKGDIELRKRALLQVNLHQER